MSDPIDKILEEVDEIYKSWRNEGCNTPSGLVYRFKSFLRHKLEEQEKDLEDMILVDKLGKEHITVDEHKKALEEQQDKFKESVEREEWYDNLVHCKIRGKHVSVKAYIEYLEEQRKNLMLSDKVYEWAKSYHKKMYPCREDTTCPKEIIYALNCLEELIQHQQSQIGGEE